jgi:protein NrfC
MAGDDNKKKTADEKKLSRRAFVVGSGTVLAGGVIIGASAAAAQGTAQQQKASYPPSTRYLVYDSRLCAGCLSCMMSCSLVHDGESNLSLSRIQVHRAFLNKYPSDLHQNVCRQCPVPLCVDRCPTGACHINTANGNVRMIDEAKCIGCQICISSCPHRPHRIIWDQAKKKATKCDMCLNTPFYNKKGGVAGTQACAEFCPNGSLRVVDEMPDQADLRGGSDRGYDRNLAPPPKPKGAFGAGGAGAKAAPGAKPDGPGAKPDAKTPPAKSAPAGN